MKRIMMANGCDAAQKIAYSSPPQVSLLRDLPVSLDNPGVNLMDLLRPLCRVSIGRIACGASEFRKQSELEVLVRIDQPWQKHIGLQIECLRYYVGIVTDGCDASIVYQDSPVSPESGARADARIRKLKSLAPGRKLQQRTRSLLLQFQDIDGGRSG